MPHPSRHRLLRLVLLALTVIVATVASPQLAVADATVVETEAAANERASYRYAHMTAEEAYAELDRRGVPYVKVERKMNGVLAPVRLSGSLHGVHIHSSLPEEQRATSAFEILDARLALSLDDFALLLERHGVVEVVHFTMYRPNGLKPGSEHDHGDEPKADEKPIAKKKDTKKRATKKRATKKRAETKKRATKKRAAPKKKRATPKKKAALGKGSKGDKHSASRSTSKSSSKQKTDPKKKKVSPGKSSKRAKKPAATKKRASSKKRSANSKRSSKKRSADSKRSSKKRSADSKRSSKKRSADSKRSSKKRGAKKTEADEPVKTVAYSPPGTRHPAGLAIDVGGFRKSDGRWLGVAQHFRGKIGRTTCGNGASPANVTESRELWSIACESVELGIFTYVLTPNYDAAHADHFHMEIRPGVTWHMVK